MSFHTPNMMKLGQGPEKSKPNKKKVVLPENGKVVHPFETIDEEVKWRIPKWLKIVLYILLGAGTIIGLFFLFLYILVSGCETVGKDLGF